MSKVKNFVVCVHITEALILAEEARIDIVKLITLFESRSEPCAPLGVFIRDSSVLSATHGVLVVDKTLDTTAVAESGL